MSWLYIIEPTLNILFLWYHQFLGLKSKLISANFAPFPLKSASSWYLFSMIAYGSFLEWNPDPEVASTAEKLYGDINNLELYVGLQAEDSKPVIEGAGLCPGRFLFSSS